MDNSESTLTLTNFLCFLRQRLLDAKQHEDTEALSELARAIELLEEAAWEAKDQKHGALLEDMRLAIGDYFHGVEWKSTIPTEEEIKAASQQTE